jgi:hypothetical protein
MSIRNAVLATAACALLAWSPADLSAQDRGQDHAALGAENADSPGKSWKARGELPGGIQKKVDRGGSLPPGIDRLFGGEPSSEPAPEPEPEPDVTPDEGTGTDDEFCSLFGCDSGGSTGGLPGM